MDERCDKQYSDFSRVSSLLLCVSSICVSLFRSSRILWLSSRLYHFYYLWWKYLLTHFLPPFCAICAHIWTSLSSLCKYFPSEVSCKCSVKSCDCYLTTQRRVLFFVFSCLCFSDMCGHVCGLCFLSHLPDVQLQAFRQPRWLHWEAPRHEGAAQTRGASTNLIPVWVSWG